MQRKNVTLDPVDLYTRAAEIVIRESLAKVHGTRFALYFAEEHAEAIQYAVRERLRGRTVAQRFDLAAALANRALKA